MASATEIPTAGKVTGLITGGVIFAPRGTSYEMYLKLIGDAPPLDIPVLALIRGTARKLWTVPSGGNFLVPIQGPTKIVQGRVKSGDEKQLVVHAGANLLIDLPKADAALELANGAIAVGTMVNVTLLPGATVQFVGEYRTQPSTEHRPIGAGAGTDEV